MCRRITCPTCRKQTWTGCGSHISSVLRGVTEENRCRCRELKSLPSRQPVQHQNSVPINPFTGRQPNGGKR